MIAVVIFPSPHLYAIMWFIPTCQFMFHPIRTGPSYGAAGRQAGRPLRVAAGQAVKAAGRNDHGKPLCGSFCTQPPDIAGGMSPPLLNYWRPSFCCKYVKSNVDPSQPPSRF